MTARLLIVCPLLIIGLCGAYAQEAFIPYYVVIGGFKNEDNAQKYCVYAHEQNLPALYALHEERGLFYVYVRATQAQDVAEDILSRLQRGTVFKDAWVFNGRLSGAGVVARQSAILPENQTSAEELHEESPIVIGTPGEEVREVTEVTPPPIPDKQKVEPPKPVGKPFVFRLLDKETGAMLPGVVRLQESDRAQQFRQFKGNEKVYVTAPANRSGKWVVVSQALGFRQLRRPIDYAGAQDLDGVSLGPEHEIIIPLELQPVKRGDYIEMENVKFYNNAALFAPGSEHELDQLVAMMQQNSGYQIRLHGHTNGNEARDIVSVGTSTDFFTPNTANAKSRATAKELAVLRAELVKTYLISKGIEGLRISTKGEGGTQMIFAPGGTLAGLNDRVEVEVRKH